MNKILLCISILFAILAVYMIYTLPSHDKYDNDNDKHPNDIITSHDLPVARQEPYSNDEREKDRERESERVNNKDDDMSSASSMRIPQHRHIHSHSHSDGKKGGGIEGCPYLSGKAYT